MQVSVRPLLTLNLLSIELQRHPEAEQNVYPNVPSCFNTILLSQFQLDVSCGVIDSTLADCTPGPYVLKPIWVLVDLYEPRNINTRRLRASSTEHSGVHAECTVLMHPTPLQRTGKRAGRVGFVGVTLRSTGLCLYTEVRRCITSYRQDQSRTGVSEYGLAISYDPLLGLRYSTATSNQASY